MTWWRRRSFPTTVFVSDFRIALKCFMSLGDLASIQGGLKYNCRLCPKSQKYLWEVWRMKIQRCMYLETWKPASVRNTRCRDGSSFSAFSSAMDFRNRALRFCWVNEGEKQDQTGPKIYNGLRFSPLGIREDIFCEHPLGGAHPECQRCNVSSCFEHLRQLKDRRPGPTAFGRSPHSVSFESVEKYLTPSGLTD